MQRRRGILEIIKDYDMRGRVFPSEDVSLLAHELHEAIEVVLKEPGNRRLHASQFEFQQQRHCQQTLEVYESLIKHGVTRKIGRTTVERSWPRVSIIIPFYNAHEHARDTIHSAFASDYPNFEVILINDGSTDQDSNSSCPVRQKSSLS